MSGTPEPRVPRPRPRTREEALAWDLALGLADLEAVPLYLSLASKHPEFLLRRIMAHVQELPAHRIKKSRGALFNYMIQQYDATTKQQSNDHRP